MSYSQGQTVGWFFLFPSNSSEFHENLNEITCATEIFIFPIKSHGWPVKDPQSVVGLVETCRRWHQRRGNNGSVEAVSSGLTEAAKKMVMPLGGKIVIFIVVFFDEISWDLMRAHNQAIAVFVGKMAVVMAI